MSLLEKVRAVEACPKCERMLNFETAESGFTALDGCGHDCDTCLSLIISVIREEVIEECAKVADKYLGAHAVRIAAEIRAMKEVKP